MIMRYGVIISSSQHWAIPKTVYQKLINLYDINYEAFALPLNSQLMMVLPKSTEYFSSLFYDTDKYFGSVGSFFNLLHRNLYISYFILHPSILNTKHYVIVDIETT